MQYVLVMQFNDCIIQGCLNDQSLKFICKPHTMMKRHIVRGYNEKIFFAERQGHVEKIQQVQFHNSKAGKLVKQEIF